MVTCRFPDLRKQIASASRLFHEVLIDRREHGLQRSLQALSPAAYTDFSLSKATSKLKRPAQCKLPLRSADSGWARSDADKETAFAKGKVYFAHFQKCDYADEKLPI